MVVRASRARQFTLQIRKPSLGGYLWVVIQASRARQFTCTCFGRAAGLMASNEDKLRRRRERDRLRRQMEAVEEREARSINRLGHFGIYLCDVYIR